MAGEYKEVSPEKYFLMYSFPCIGNLLHENKISKSDASNLENILFQNKTIERNFLEFCFPNAFRRIKTVAKEMEKNYWDMEVIRKYWLEEHNKFIDLGDGDYAKATPSFRELCKVHKAEVVEKKKNVITVKYGEVLRKVFAKFVPDVSIGDKVTVHLAFAIEKLD